MAKSITAPSTCSQSGRNGSPISRMTAPCRSVVGQNRVAAMQRRGGTREPRFLGCRVVAVGVDDQWPRRRRVVDAEQVAGQCDVLVRDRDALDGSIHQTDRLAERLA